MQPYELLVKQILDEMFNGVEHFDADKASADIFIEQIAQKIEGVDELELMLKSIEANESDLEQSDWMIWANNSLTSNKQTLRERHESQDMEVVFSTTPQPKPQKKSEPQLDLKIFLEGDVSIERDGDDLKISRTLQGVTKLAIEKKEGQIKVPRDNLMDETFLLQAAEVALKTSEPDASIRIKVPDHVKSLGVESESLYVKMMNNALRQVGVDAERIIRPIAFSPMDAESSRPESEASTYASSAINNASSASSDTPEQPINTNSGSKTTQESSQRESAPKEPIPNMLEGYTNPNTGFVNFKKFIDHQVKAVLADMLAAKVVVTSENFNDFVDGSEKAYGVKAVGEFRGMSFTVDKAFICEDELSPEASRASAKRVKASDIQGATKKMNEIKKIVRAEQAEQIKKLAGQEAEKDAYSSPSPQASAPKMEPIPTQTPAPKKSTVTI